MRMIIEVDIERMDFQEIILSKKDLDKLMSFGVVKEFKSGFNSRPLNLFIRRESKNNIINEEEMISEE